MTTPLATLERAGPVATLTLNRPDVRNAFNPQLINNVVTALEDIANDASIRVLVLTGAGAAFCAGADLNWMRESLAYSREQNLADATALDALFETLNSLPKPVIGRINGAALGGGVGLVACCDLAVAVEEARFGFSEVKLGIIPAVIAQYVVPKIGVSQSRALFVSGEQFSAERAFEIGLIHAITGSAELDDVVRALCGRLLTSGPQAVGAAKELIAAVWERERAAAKEFAIAAIASVRTSPEGQEGLSAFLEKRRPTWHTT